MKTFATITGISSWILCLTAGIYILSQMGLSISAEEGEELKVVWQAMGIYFIAKGFFVGPMLIVAGRK